MTDPDNDNPRNPAHQKLGKERLRPPLSARFYTQSAVAKAEGGHSVTLDSRPLKTPAKQSLVVPTLALARAIAAEWAAQGSRIDPASMPLTRLANTSLDAVAPAREAVAADIAAFAGTDAVCYRAQSPPDLVARQGQRFDPVLDWAAETLDAKLAVTRSLSHIPQPPAALDAIARSLAPLSAWELAPLHVMTTLTGSALLALAVAHARLTANAAWAAAHVDEDWQMERWGGDEEARIRRANRWTEMAAAAQFLALVRQA